MKTGDIIKILRERRGLSQSDLASLLRLSRSSVSMYESNNRIPSTYVLQDLSDIFNVDIDYILGKTNKTTVLPERLKFDASKLGKLIFENNDFTLYSGSRQLKSGASSFIGSQLNAMTEPVRRNEIKTIEIEQDPEVPSREYMIHWLNNNILTAAYDGGFNYERLNDDDLRAYYEDIRSEVENEDEDN